MSKVLDLGDELTFGKYKGYTVRDVLDEDKSYIQWLIEQGTSFTEAVESEL